MREVIKLKDICSRLNQRTLNRFEQSKLKGGDDFGSAAGGTTGGLTLPMPKPCPPPIDQP